jgi:hypothetical protein
MWKNLLLVTLAGMLVGILVGCSNSAGHKYDVTAVDRMVVGQTTERDVIAMAGLPLSEKKLSNGNKLYNYAYGVRCPLDAASSIALMQVQIYNGVVINKWQGLMEN